MISLSHAVNGFAILALTCTCDAATLSSSVLYVTRTRNIATHEEYLVRISVSYLTADLTLGTTSHALIESPGGELRSIPLGMERGGDVTFSATFPLSSLDAASGNWSVTVNDGAQAHEDVVLLVPVLNASNFTSYPGFPTPSYLGNSYKVFVPLVASGAEASASATGNLSSALVTNGTVYTFPGGGPFGATSGRSISLPSITIKTTGGQFLGWVASAKAKSDSTILVHTGPTPHPFAGTCQLTSGSAVFETSGLVPGHSYTLWRSPTLGAWQSVSTFTAPSNVHRHQETMAASGMFFRLEENP
jgi:hypothetical protein